MNEEKKIYPQILPDIEDWPIHKLSQDRPRFVEDVKAFTFQRLARQSPKQLHNMLAKTTYLERIRIKEEPWKVDPPKEGSFWRKASSRLMKSSMDGSPDIAHQRDQDILRSIIHRYTEEIVGTFNTKTFLFARRFLTFFFNRLLNAVVAGKRIYRVWGSRHRLADRLIVKGEVEAVRSLMARGTVVVVPTHFSNLDSIMIGYVLDAFAGLPSFSYGAGLNLYNTGYTAYFMNRLGAYRVDRRKKNAIYLETLKSMSNLSIQRGTNTLFFPGGTRSRSGALEQKLKLGLLGTTVEAQQAIFAQGRSEKVFVVPIVVSYHFVLEAQFLIDQHLSYTGKEQYVKSRDASYSIRRWTKFIWQLFSEGNDITLSFGQPLDVLGHSVDAQGRSFDQYGNELDIRDYFSYQGQVTENLQRESEYTKMLADRIVERFQKDNIVLSSHLVAYAAFLMLQRQNHHLDLYGILRLPPSDYVFTQDVLEDVVQQLREALFDMEERGDIKVADILRGDLQALIRDGVARLGNYHVTRPLIFNKKGQIVSENFRILYFYHNRMANYGLHTAIKWRNYEMEEVEA